MIYVRWENLSNNRYYTATLLQDLLKDWIIVKSWGSKSRWGGKKTILCSSYEEGLKMIEKINIDRKKRGYQKSNL